MYTRPAVITAVVAMCFTAVHAATVPFKAHAAHQNGTCKLESSTHHSIGGGGPGQAPINQYTAGLNCYNSAGDFVYKTQQEAVVSKGVTTIATAANCGLPVDVTVHITYNSAAHHYVSCTYNKGNATGQVGAVTDKIDSGTVSNATTTCTFSVPC